MESSSTEQGDDIDKFDDNIIPIYEYGETLIPYSEEEQESLKEDKAYFGKEGKKNLHPSGAGKVGFIDEEDIPYFKNGPYFGELLLPSGKQLSLEAKTETIPIKLLNYSTGVKCNDNKNFLYYDVEYSPKIERGKSFFSFLGEAFLKELEKILEKGFVREYVKKEENLDYLKGKLLFDEQVKKNFANPKFYCNYFDLTIDNFCNQMVLYSCYKLTELLKIYSGSEIVRSELFNYVEDLKNRISLPSEISPKEANNVFITRKNEYYRGIIELSKIIINETFYRSRGTRKQIGYNYLINMNVIFERTIFKLFSEVLNNFQHKKRYDLILKDQKVYKRKNREDGIVDLPDNKSFTLIPDITVFSEKEDLPIAVIDTKYKSSISNNDYYQIITYSLFLKKLNDKFNTAIFVHYREEEETDKDRFDIQKGKINLSEFSQFQDSEKGLDDIDDIDLFRISINIKEDEDEDFKVKEHLEKKLENQIRYGGNIWSQLRDSMKI
ncbi:MAG: 5-methylcytosine restriction system specificity protein McrC [Thermoplasmatota archaeon]